MLGPMTHPGSGEPTNPIDARLSGVVPPGAAAPPQAGGAGNHEPDWTDQVTDLVVETVDKVRDRTTGPVLNVAHASVYGLVAAVVVVPVLIALFVGLFRLLNWAVPGDVWISYAIVAGLMLVSGWVLWSKRERPERS